MRDKTSAQIAEIFGVDESTVKRWVGLGCPCDHKGKRYPRKFDEGEVAQWARSNNKTGKPGRPQTEGGKELEAAKIRKENALATRYEIEVAERRGELVETAEVERRNVQKVTALRNVLLSLPASLGPALVGMDALGIQQEIERAVATILDEFAQR